MQEPSEADLLAEARERVNGWVLMKLDIYRAAYGYASEAVKIFGEGGEGARNVMGRAAALVTAVEEWQEGERRAREAGTREELQRLKVERYGLGEGPIQWTQF